MMPAIRMHSIRKLLVFPVLMLGIFAALLWWYRRAPQPEVDHPRLAPGIILQDVTFYSRALQREM
jgi:hypothetical protein